MCRLKVCRKPTSSVRVLPSTPRAREAYVAHARARRVGAQHGDCGGTAGGLPSPGQRIVQLRDPLNWPRRRKGCRARRRAPCARTRGCSWTLTSRSPLAGNTSEPWLESSNTSGGRGLGGRRPSRALSSALRSRDAPPPPPPRPSSPEATATASAPRRDAGRRCRRVSHRVRRGLGRDYRDRRDRRDHDAALAETSSTVDGTHPEHLVVDKVRPPSARAPSPRATIARASTASAAIAPVVVAIARIFFRARARKWPALEPLSKLSLFVNAKFFSFHRALEKPRGRRQKG